MGPAYCYWDVKLSDNILERKKEKSVGGAGATAAAALPVTTTAAAKAKYSIIEVWLANIHSGPKRLINWLSRQAGSLKLLRVRQKRKNTHNLWVSGSHRPMGSHPDLTDG